MKEVTLTLGRSLVDSAIIFIRSSGVKKPEGLAGLCPTPTITSSKMVAATTITAIQPTQAADPSAARVIKRASHFLQEDEPEQIVALIQDFLKKNP